MVSIDISEFVIRLKSRMETEDTDETARVWAGTRWSDRTEDSLKRNTFDRLSDPIVGVLDRKLSALEDSLARFKWPQDDLPWRRARLVVPDPDLEDKVSAEVHPADTAQRFYKYFSAGLPGSDTASLAPGTYTFTLKVGEGLDEKDEISVSITQGMTWHEAMTAVADAVNDSSLPVQAEVIRQGVPGQKVPDLGSVGSILAFSINPGQAYQDLDLVEGTGRILEKLDMAATEAPVGAPTQKRYDLVGLTRFNPSTYTSEIKDPDAETGLTPGDYSFTFSIGSTSGTYTVSVASGASWEDALYAAANVINSDSDEVMAEVIEADRPYYEVEGERLTGEGLYLKVSAASPKIGERLVLTDGDDGFLSSLNMTSSAWPGTDARMRINGEERVSETGTFSLDKGRLTVDLDSVFGESLPLRVVSALEEIETGLGDVIASYNDLRTFLVKNGDLFKSELIDPWREPLENKAVDLEWMGLKEAGQDKTVWFNRDDFYSALGQDADRSEDTLLGDLGLVSSWRDTASLIREAGPAEYLVSANSLEDLEPPAFEEFDLERKARLLDLIG